MVTITTTYKTNATGAGKILAKGAGKQRTVNYDPALSVARNHGHAAGVLALALDFPSDAADICQTTDNGDGTRTFRFLF